LSQNNKGYKRISDILSETQRTFPISGAIEANDASSGSLVFYDLPFDALLCPKGTGSVTGISEYKPNKNLKLTQRTASSK
jgi:hypothetical protein